MRSYTFKLLVSIALFCAGAVTAAVLPELDKRVVFCVGVTGDFCIPGVLECCDSSSTCLVDADGEAVSSSPLSKFEFLTPNLISVLRGTSIGR